MFPLLLEHLKHFVDVLHDGEFEVHLRLRRLLDLRDAAPDVESLLLLEFLCVDLFKTTVIKDCPIGVVLDRSM